jgi:hypothetical protein
MINRPTLANVCSKGKQGPAQNGEGLGAIQLLRVWYPPLTRPGVKYRPNVTQNEHTERWNPPTALPAAGVGDQAECLGGEDGSRSECLMVMMRIG